GAGHFGPPGCILLYHVLDVFAGLDEVLIDRQSILDEGNDVVGRVTLAQEVSDVAKAVPVEASHRDKHDAHENGEPRTHTRAASMAAPRRFQRVQTTLDV